MTITLANDVESILEEQVRHGACADADASDLVNDILRSVREQQCSPFEVSPELENWLLVAADQPVTPLRAEAFQAVRQRVRARIPAPRP